MKNHNRESGVELLRILSLLGVIFIHYSDILLPVLDTNGIENVFVHVIRTISAASVDVFLIISGYYMCMNNKRTYGKPFDLIIQVSFYAVLVYLITVLIKHSHFSVSILIGNLIPDSYFTTFFVIVYVLSPYINILLNKLHRNELKILMIILLLVFSFYSTATTFLDEISTTKWMGLNPVGAWGSQQGFNIVNFMLCYIVGAYLRLNGFPSCSKRLLLSVIGGSIFLLVAWSLMENRWDITGMRSAWVYDNPLVILIGASSFYLFKGIKFSSAIVNKCAKLVYPTFLIHCFIIGDVQIGAICSISIVHLVAHFLMFTIIMFAISFLLYKAYYYIIGKQLAKLDSYSIKLMLDYDER